MYFHMHSLRPRIEETIISTWRSRAVSPSEPRYRSPSKSISSNGCAIFIQDNEFLDTNLEKNKTRGEQQKDELDYSGIFPKTPEDLHMPDEDLRLKNARKAITSTSWASQNPVYSFPSLCSKKYINQNAITRREDHSNIKSVKTESYIGALECFADEFKDLKTEHVKKRVNKRQINRDTVVMYIGKKNNPSHKREGTRKRTAVVHIAEKPAPSHIEAANPAPPKQGPMEAESFTSSFLWELAKVAKNIEGQYEHLEIKRIAQTTASPCALPLSKALCKRRKRANIADIKKKVQGMMKIDFTTSSTKAQA